MIPKQLTTKMPDNYSRQTIFRLIIKTWDMNTLLMLIMNNSRNLLSNFVYQVQLNIVFEIGTSRATAYTGAPWVWTYPKGVTSCCQFQLD